MWRQRERYRATIAHIALPHKIDYGTYGCGERPEMCGFAAVPGAVVSVLNRAAAQTPMSAT